MKNQGGVMLLIMLVFGLLAHLVVLQMVEVVFPCEDHFEVKVFCIFLISSLFILFYKVVIP